VKRKKYQLAIMEKLTAIVKDMARCLGAVEVGIATLEILDGRPPSTDLKYVLPDAKSALCFALPLNQDVIEPSHE
jgi:epoxyqueuosine reductase QueG